MNTKIISSFAHPKDSTFIDEEVQGNHVISPWDNYASARKDILEQKSEVIEMRKRPKDLEEDHVEIIRN